MWNFLFHLSHQIYMERLSCLTNTPSYYPDSSTNAIHLFVFDESSIVSHFKIPFVSLVLLFLNCFCVFPQVEIFLVFSFPRELSSRSNTQGETEKSRTGDEVQEHSSRTKINRERKKETQSEVKDAMRARHSNTSM